MLKFIVLFVAIVPTISAQHELSYGVKGGITRSSYLVLDEGEQWRGLHGHRTGINCGLFFKFDKFLMTDLSYVQKGAQGDRLNYISLGGYFSLPQNLYPFVGLHYDFLRSTSIDKHTFPKPTVRKSNWSFSLGIGYQEIKVYNQNFLIETKLDWIDQRQSQYTHDEDFTTLKNVSIDIKIGWYLNSIL